MPPWDVSDSACVRYAYARRWIAAGVDYDSMSDALITRVDSALAELQRHVGLRAVGQYGRELWRGSKRLGGGLWWVVDPPALHAAATTLARVLWVGHGTPPSSVWLPR